MKNPDFLYPAHHQSELANAPVEARALLQRIGAEYDTLSKQFKIIARYIEQHHQRLALEKIQTVSAQSGAQPSAIVRFAKHFGFSGFSQLQEVFRAGVVWQMSSDQQYQTRIREAIEKGADHLSSVEVADRFISGAISGMQELQRDLNHTALQDAVELLVHAPTIWIAGARRSFPIAAYLAYAFQHTDRPVHWLNALGSMQEGQLRSLKAEDVMIVVSFPPYATETIMASKQALQRGAKLIAITDSHLNPIASRADAVLLAHENSIFGFRALTNAMALAQSLFIALAYRLEINYQPDNSHFSVPYDKN